MIREQHPFALKVVQGNEVEILIDVIYESEHDIPSQLIGFETEQQMLGYMEANGLKEYDPNAPPTADWLKADIQAWLTQKRNHMDYINDQSAIIAVSAVIVALILIREGLQERYMHIEKDPVKRARLSKKWHAAGGWLRLLLTVLIWQATQCYYTTGAAAIALSLGYNITINVYKGHKWWYVGKVAATDKLIRKILFFINFDNAI